MMVRKWIFVACVGAMALGGCKTDSEEDIPGWGQEQEEGQQPETPGGDAESGTLVLNEICGLQDPDDDWVEFYNGSSTDVDVSGARLVKTDETGKVKDIYTFPEHTMVKAKGYKVVASLSGELQAGISNKKQVGLELIAADGKSLDKFDRDGDIGEGLAHEEGGSYARIPNGMGKWVRVQTCSRGAENLQ